MYHQTRIPQVFTVFGDLVLDGDYIERNRRKFTADTVQATDSRRISNCLLTALGYRSAA